MFKEECWNLSNSNFIDVEEQKSFGSDPRKRRKKENEAEGESPLRSLSKKIQYGVPTQRGGSWERRKRGE